MLTVMAGSLKQQLGISPPPFYRVGNCCLLQLTLRMTLLTTTLFIFYNLVENWQIFSFGASPAGMSGN